MSLKCMECGKKATITEEVFFVIVGHLKSDSDSEGAGKHHVCKECMGNRLGRQENKESRSDPVYLKEEQALEEQDYFRTQEE